MARALAYYKQNFRQYSITPIPLRQNSNTTVNMASKEEPNDSIGELTPPASKQLTDDEVREIIKSLGCLESVKVPAGALYIPGEYGVRTRESAGRRLWTVIARENGYPIVPEWGCTCDACIAYDTVLQVSLVWIVFMGNG
jgi:hypothetical protein